MKKTMYVLLLFFFGLLLNGCNAGEKSTESSQENGKYAVNPVIENIMTRRSVRKYKPEAVKEEQMQLIMQCGINAPNGMNAQNWAFRVVDSPTFIGGITELFIENGGEKMAQDTGFKNMFRNAPTVVFVSTRDGGNLIDAGLAVENMVLSAWSMGIGSCCLGGPVRFLNSEVAAPYLKQLNLPDGYRLVLAVGFGYPDETPAAKPRDAAKVQYIH